MKHPVGITKNKLEVYIYLTGSLASKRISRQPHLLNLAQEMFSSVTLQGTKISMEYDMQRPIGYDYVIETLDNNVVFYGRIPKDEIYTRFVKSGKPIATNKLSVVLIQDSDKNYELYDLWIGSLRPPRPGSLDETPDSKLYWSNHALILGDMPIQPRTITKTSPY